MKYNIRDVRQDGETIFVSVDYTLADSRVVSVEVPIFVPSLPENTKEAALKCLENRAATEQTKADATAIARDLMALVSEEKNKETSVSVSVAP